MEQITLKNYRCFREEQTVRLAPLTLLVGENSTGKTSFMAMIRVLWDANANYRAPDFKEDPYDLGSFDEIAHHRGARGGQAETFKAGFYAMPPHARNPKAEDEPYRFEVTFGKRGTIPVPWQRHLARGKIWIKEYCQPDKPYVFKTGTSRGSWEKQIPWDEATMPSWLEESLPFFSPMFLFALDSRDNQAEDNNFIPLDGSPAFTSEDHNLLHRLIFSRMEIPRQRPFASAPVRSKPRRTYDPARLTPDPEGDYVPMYLANMYFQDEKTWVDLKQRLEGFGKAAGLFDEISIKRLGKRDSEPFQVQVRKFGGGLKGPHRNLIDVGYGVSQVLPVITELLRSEGPPLFLLQQPEVHLHPSAQAALGSFFCQVASPDRRLVVETHSDHLLDRVRMEVRDARDSTTGLKPNDVSILFFERVDLDVCIHSLRIDEDGNLVGAPRGYRKFFMEETQRSLGL